MVMVRSAKREGSWQNGEFFLHQYKAKAYEITPISVFVACLTGAKYRMRYPPNLPLQFA